MSVSIMLQSLLKVSQESVKNSLKYPKSKNPKDYSFQSKSTNCACYCRRPIEERVVTAMGKHWHVEHFACAKCEKPFLGHRHYEKNGLAYCYFHYHQLFGSLCYHCNGVIEVTCNLFKLSLLLFFFQGDIFTALSKAWCSSHFSCTSCDKPLGSKTKFFEVIHSS